jgi:hypothetical protein
MCVLGSASSASGDDKGDFWPFSKQQHNQDKASSRRSLLQSSAQNGASDAGFGLDSIQWHKVAKLHQAQQRHLSHSHARKLVGAALQRAWLHRMID